MFLEFERVELGRTEPSEHFFLNTDNIESVCEIEKHLAYDQFRDAETYPLIIYKIVMTSGAEHLVWDDPHRDKWIGVRLDVEKHGRHLKGGY